MEEKYDVIILGTGLKECVLSGILSKEGKKVLHMDRNDYYGGASASITPLAKVFEHFKVEGTPSEALGKGRDYNVDLIPKFLMANGSLVKALVYSGVTRYLEFKQVEGSYVYQNPGKVWKVPTTAKEALTSSLMGMFQKNRYRKFLAATYNWKEEDPATWGKMEPKMPMSMVYEQFGLDASTQDFTGHAVALWRDDSYKSRPCRETIPKLKLYADSMARYGSSPYLYPLYGLGELPQGFARLSAIYGGTYMLRCAIDGFEYGEDGKIAAVRAPDPDDEDKIKPIKCDMVIGDPSYFPEKVKKVGQVARAICILDHPLPNCYGTHPSGGGYSSQIIVPANQIMPAGCKKNDVYVISISNAHNVAPQERWIAIVATQLDGQPPERELAVGLSLLGPIMQKFISVDDLLVPAADGVADQTFISTSYDATTHFETTFDDINSIYRRATGHDLDLSKAAEGDGGDGQ